MKVIFERDSVCVGDDVLAPNAEEFWFEHPPSFSELLSLEVVARYLPSVSNSRTYWTVVCNGEKIARVEHSYCNTPQAKVTFSQPEGMMQAAKVFFQYDKQETWQS